MDPANTIQYTIIKLTIPYLLCCQCFGFGPDLICIQMGQGIRIQIRNPDPRGQYCPTNKEKNIKIHF
jgi:hypothetical protein